MIPGADEVAPTLTAKPKTVVLAKKRKTAISVDAQEGGGSKRIPIPKGMNENFEALVGRIQPPSDALQQDALVVINRSVTTRAWLTGYYIVEYEQHGADRAKYGEGLLKKLAQRLSGSAFALASLKNYRKFYLTYPELCEPVAGYLISRFGKSQSLISQLAIDVGESASKGQSAISLSGNGSLLAESEGSLKIIPEVLFNRLPFTHILQLLPLAEDL